VRACPTHARRALGALAGSVALAVAVSGCAQDTSSAASGIGATANVQAILRADDYQPTKADAAQIRALMNARAKALLDGDRAAFMATVDKASDAFVAKQGVFFDNLQTLPVVSVSYSVSTNYLQPAQVAGTDPVLAPDARENVEIGGAMTHPVSNWVHYTFVRRHGHWLVGAETEDKGDSSEAPQSRPWFGTRIAVAHAGDVVVVTDANGPVTPQHLLDVVGADLARDRGILGYTGVRSVLVDATTNGNTTALYASKTEVAGAITRALYDQEGRGALAGMLIQANPTAVQQLLYNQQTLRHELTHLILRFRDGWAPTWAVEGIAEYVSTYPGERSFTFPQLDYARVAKESIELPNSALFGDQANYDYAISQAAVAWIVQHESMSGFFRLLDYYQRAQSLNPDLLTAHGLQTLFGVSEHELDQGAHDLLLSWLAAH
jgi:hypothetical protein